MSTKHIEALKLALEGAANYIDALGGDSRKYRQALAEQPAQQEPVAITIQQAHDMGAKGAEPTEEERLLFEAWMRGHCWAVMGEWDGKTYKHEAETSGWPHPGTMLTRQLWAAWRDRAALAPAKRKPLTDDPLQGAVDWLLEADGEYFCTATVQRTLRIGYNRAKRLCDTAKERAAHGIKGDA